MMKLNRVTMLLCQFAAGMSMVVTIAQARAFELTYEAHSPQALSQPHDITLSPDQRYL